MIKKFVSTKLKRAASLCLMPVRRWLISTDGKMGSLVQKLTRKLIHFIDYILVRSFGSHFIEFEISSACNARCIFCLYPDIIKSGKRLKNMDKETFAKAVEKIEQSNYSLISFTPTTGDIFMNKEWEYFVEQMLYVSKIKQIFFYSNAILLNDSNQDKLIEILKKDKKKKIFALLFSLGGLDRETYNIMFGVDKFNEVLENINQFQKKLKDQNILVRVSLEFRLPKNHKLDFEKAHQMFNQHNYDFCSIEVLYKYMNNDAIPKLDNLEYMDEVKNPTRACTYLYKTRYAADGGVWADGCMISEMPDDNSLQLGTVDDSMKNLEENRQKIIYNWEQKHELPKPCQGCSFYR